MKIETVGSNTVRNFNLLNHALARAITIRNSHRKKIKLTLFRRILLRFLIGLLEMGAQAIKPTQVH